MRGKWSGVMAMLAVPGLFDRDRAEIGEDALRIALFPAQRRVSPAVLRPDHPPHGADQQPVLGVAADSLNMIWPGVPKALPPGQDMRRSLAERFAVATCR